MQFPDTVAANGRPAALLCGAGARSELDELRSLCRSQALALDALGQAASTLRRGAVALKADNAALRAERDRPPGSRRGDARAPDWRLDVGWACAVRLPCDARAPGAARMVVAQRLRDRVAANVLDSALLLVSELVTNSVRHSGARREDAVMVGVWLGPAVVRLEVEDPGRGGVIAPRLPDPDGGGLGLQLVQALSERWGLERVAAGGTLVWAQLPRSPVSGAPSSGEPGNDARARPALSPIPIDQRAGGPRSTPAGRDTMTELHVIPDERTTWRVYEDGASAPLSEHTNATDAERAALTRAEGRDAPRVVVHDRYHRTHETTGSSAELQARA
jgi:serine/threonine-protein kinase RsbW